jgi:uncharacterized protein YbaR (Trm112 family)
MTISPELLNLLRCPETKQPLRIALAECIAQLEAKRQAGELRNRADELVRAPIEAALIREDGLVVYPFEDGIPNLLPGKAIPVG